MTVRGSLFGYTLEKVIGIFETFHFLFEVFAIVIKG
jgi:hypothetical protein